MLGGWVCLTGCSHTKIVYLQMITGRLLPHLWTNVHVNDKTTRSHGNIPQPSTMTDECLLLANNPNLQKDSATLCTFYSSAQAMLTCTESLTWKTYLIIVPIFGRNIAISTQMARMQQLRITTCFSLKQATIATASTKANGAVCRLWTREA